MGIWVSRLCVSSLISVRMVPASATTTTQIHIPLHPLIFCFNRKKVLKWVYELHVCVCVCVCVCVSSLNYVRTVPVSAIKTESMHIPLHALMYAVIEKKRKELKYKYIGVMEAAEYKKMTGNDNRMTQWLIEGMNGQKEGHGSHCNKVSKQLWHGNNSVKSIFVEQSQSGRSSSTKWASDRVNTFHTPSHVI